MSGPEDTARWRPDDALEFTVRTRKLPIADLSGPDRAWLVAQLTVHGWTVQRIAEQLSCSLRLVQQIKAEPGMLIALYALQLERELSDEKAMRRLAENVHSRERCAHDRELSRVTAQRDLLLERIPRKAHTP